MGILDGYMERMREQEGSPVHDGWRLAEEAVRLLDQIAEGVNEADDEDVHPIALPFVIDTDGTGFGSQELPLPPGTGWKLLTLAFWGGATGQVAFYVDMEAGTNLIAVRDSAAIVDDTFADGHLIPAQSRLLIVTRGQPANQKVTGRVSARAFTKKGERAPR
jgi:hypothetical protein